MRSITWEVLMRKTSLAIPIVALIGATRGMLGAGIALLIADRMNAERRTKVGRILFAIGALSTIPLATAVLRSRNRGNSLRRGSGWQGRLGDAE
jgi:hypothetical protein